MDFNELYKQLKEKRIEKGYTQKEIAEHLQIDVTTFSNYEAGKRNLPADVLDKWLQFFGLKLTVKVEYDTSELLRKAQVQIEENKQKFHSIRAKMYDEDFDGEFSLKNFTKEELAFLNWLESDHRDN